MTTKLPQGWEWSEFSAVVRIAANLADPNLWPDFPHIAPDNIERDTGRLLEYRTISEDGVTSAKHRFHAGQLLYSKIRPYLNKCVRVDFEGLCSADMYPLDPMIEPGYLHYYMLTREFVDAVGAAAGSRTVLPKTNQKQLSAVPVAVAPLPEQQKIAATLDSYFTRLDDAIATLERVQRNLKRYRASVLKAAVEGRLVPTEAELAREENRDCEPASVLLGRILAERRRRWEETELAKMKAKGKVPKDDKWKAKYKEPVAPDTGDLPELPEGWCWATVDQLAAHEDSALTDGPFGSNLKSVHYTSEGPRVVRLQNIGDGEFHDERAHISEKHYQSLSKHAVRTGDLVVASLGTDLPRACLIPAMLGPAIVKADCLRFAPHADLIDSRYAMHALNSPPTRARTLDQVHGVGRPRLGLTLFRETAVPLPPCDEQARIVDAVESSESLARSTTVAAESDLQRFAVLRQSILKWAFEGRLVDQDPSDEPASVLLERIRAEREAAAASKPKRATRRKTRSPKA